MTAATTSTTSLLLGVAAREVAGELVGDAAAARAPLQGPLQRFLFYFFRISGIKGLEPLADDVEVLVLVEGIEGDPQAEALRERDFFLHGLARMDLVVDVLGLEVLGHV